MAKQSAAGADENAVQSAYEVHRLPKDENNVLTGRLDIIPKSGSQPDIEQKESRAKLESMAFTLRIAFRNDLKSPCAEQLFETLQELAERVFNNEFYSPLAETQENNFKHEVVQVAGPRVKSRYLKNLLGWVVIAFAILIIFAHIPGWLTDFTSQDDKLSKLEKRVKLLEDPEKQSVKEKPKEGVTPSLTQPKSATEAAEDVTSISIFHTGYLLAFSMWGLFFASCSRNISPTYDTLSIPEGDLLKPWVRLLFYGIAILTIASAFQLEMVTLSFGEKFSTDSINDNVSVAILIGLLLGIAERALPAEANKYAAGLLTKSQQDQ